MTTTTLPLIEPVVRGRALAHAFELRCNDEPAGAALGAALAGLASGDPTGDATAYDLVYDGDTAHWSLYIDREAPDGPLRRSRYPVERLVWSINQAAVSETGDLVRVHAAVAERDGLAVVLPASMEAGKTTLVTALVRDGFGYLSDEVAAIDPRAGDIFAYPKPLGLDRGSWPLFPDLRPESVGGVFDRQWLVNADRVRPGATKRTARPALVVAPRYRAGADGTPRPIAPVDALRALVDQTFRFHDHPQRDLETLARLVEAVPCYQLEVDDLDRATSVVHNLFDEIIRGT